MNGTNVELEKEVWKNFDGQPHIFLATAGGGQPRVRHVTLIHLHDTLFVATGSSDPKVKQLKQNPRTEFCLLLEKGGRKGTIRAECMVQIVEDKDARADVYNNVSFTKEFWASSEDPNYALIELQPTSLEYMKPGSVQSVKIKL